MNRRCLFSSDAVAALTALSLLFATSAFCQEPHPHDHMQHGHDQRQLELGMSVGYVQLDEEGEEDETAPAAHLHVTRRLSDGGIGRRLAVGLGAETIFGEHEHYAAMLPVVVSVWRGLIFSIAPGLEWAKHEGEWEYDYATHLEAAYVFEVSEYDIGPVIEYSRSGQDSHLMIGLHFGIHL